MKRKMAKILQDREAAVKAVHNRTANVDQDDASIVRERSVLLFVGVIVSISLGQPPLSWGIRMEAKKEREPVRWIRTMVLISRRTVTMD